ncbi:uncharacterized protein EDB91DRAFT_1085460 [Suillus paluster]|uniref:uncharacterized protein n=1 Tax=Suillus paluster TaxID=48578 RepID=UPI001B87EE14|nr:uncharacterized protein EDB91DRAFT_1085460 [Suillus paluster]KAG1730405.1 hypothetical protein EDB91DRAFT_1085460 [Suillus paluster]
MTASWNKNKLFIQLFITISFLRLKFSKYSISQNNRNVSKKVVVQTEESGQQLDNDQLPQQEQASVMIKQIGENLPRTLGHDFEACKIFHDLDLIEREAGKFNMKSLETIAKKTLKMASIREHSSVGPLVVEIKPPVMKTKTDIRSEMDEYGYGGLDKEEKVTDEEGDEEQVDGLEEANDEVGPEDGEVDAMYEYEGNAEL